MTTTDRPTSHMTVAAVTLEDIEADARMAMARVQKARGFDTQKVRDRQIAEVDVILDAYNWASAVE